MTINNPVFKSNQPGINGDVRHRCILLLLLFSLCAHSDLMAQNYDLRGQLWGNAVLGSDPSPNRSHLEEFLGYIPTLSAYKEFGGSVEFDLEIGYKASYLLDGLFGTGDGGANWESDLYRMWGRYSTGRTELRVGLQKIAFGPGRILRPLEWFDTLDPRDPTGQTEGVTALRGRYFTLSGLSFWGWVVRPDNVDYAAPGGRIEKTFSLGELGMTFHHRPGYESGGIVRRAGRSFLAESSSEDRFALDLRMDVEVGFWGELMLARATDAPDGSPDSRRVAMVGGDYTLPFGNGVYVMVEHLADIQRPDYSGADTGKHFTALLADYPLGLLDRVSGIVEYDWENDRIYNFVWWQRTYDNWILNLILFTNPKRESYSFEVPETLMGFGSGLQLMIIYNH